MIAEPAHFYLFGLICLCSGNPASSFFTLHSPLARLFTFPDQPRAEFWRPLPPSKARGARPLAGVLEERVLRWYFVLSLSPHPPRPSKPLRRPRHFAKFEARPGLSGQTRVWARGGRGSGRWWAWALRMSRSLSDRSAASLGKGAVRPGSCSPETRQDSWTWSCYSPLLFRANGSLVVVLCNQSL